MEHVEERLLKWAQGSPGRSAGVRLLVRHGRVITENAPWFVEHSSGELSLDVETLRRETRTYSDGEIAVIDIAASLLGGEPVDLSEAVSALGHSGTHLVLSAIAEAAGFEHPTRSIAIVDGQARRVDLPALYSWEMGPAAAL